MNCTRLSGPLVTGPLQFSRVITCVGKYRTSNFTLLHNSNSVRSYYNGCRILESFRSRLRKGLQRHGSAVFGACTQQAQYIVAHRVWRGQQASVLYLKLWGSVAFSALVSRVLMRILVSFGHCIRSKYHRFLLSCSGLSIYDWKKNRITTSELNKYTNDVEVAHCLKRRTVDIGQTTVTSRCTCMNGKGNHSKFERERDPWSVFLELEHLLVWKRDVPGHRGNGLFEYKVYGLYNDVTANDFVATNIDTTYRKMWDSAAVVLEVLESQPTSTSDVIYWEVAWPKLMNNRDYVYQRRYMVDRRRKVAVIINKDTMHPLVPVKPGKERVTEYWSIIVIKPITEMNEPGIEFTMTYFDNPGSNLPTSVTQWASLTAFPDFHKRLHDAAKVYSSKRKEIDKFAKADIARKGNTKATNNNGRVKAEGDKTQEDVGNTDTEKSKTQVDNDKSQAEKDSSDEGNNKLQEGSAKEKAESQDTKEADGKPADKPKGEIYDINWIMERLMPP